MTGNLAVADFVILGIYFITIAGLGFWAARRVKDVSDYVMPRRFGRVMMMMHAFGTGTHSDHAVGVASKTYTNGLSGIWYQWMWLFATPFYWLIAPVMRRFRATTTADVFEARYDRSVSMLYAAIGMIQFSVNIGVMLIASGKLVESGTGGAISSPWAIGIMTVVFVAYGMAGGLSAAILTDFIQGILTVIFSFILLFPILNAVGGLAGLRESIPGIVPDKDMFTLVAPGEIGFFYIAVIALNAMVGIVVQPHTMGTCAAGRTEADGQFGFMAGNFIKRLCTVAWTLTGLAAVAYFVGKDVDPDHVFGRAASEFLPAILPGLLGLFIASVVASVTSSCDSFMIASAGLFTQNLFRPLFPRLSERFYLLTARLASLAVVAGGVLFALWLDKQKGGVITGIEIFWKTASMMGIAFWLGLFWRRMTVDGAWAATLSALVVWAWTEQTFVASMLGNVYEGFTVGEGDKLKMYLPWQMVMYLSAGLLGGLGASLKTRPVNASKLDAFYALTRTPVLPGEARPPGPCKLPEGVTAPEPRLMISAGGLVIPKPSRRSVIGFLIGWGIVVILVVGFVLLVN